jgi:hypothetical protein
VTSPGEKLRVEPRETPKRNESWSQPPTTPNAPASEPPELRGARLRELLQAQGLSGWVRVGGGGVAGKVADVAVDGAGRARTPSPVSPSPLPDAGSSSLDALLRPLERPAAGAVIEIGGAPSSGRTALAYRMAVGTTLRGELVGWIDPGNALDPRFLARAGADLTRVLWIRPLEPRGALRAAELLLRAGFAAVVLDLEGVPARTVERWGRAPWSRLARAARGSRAVLVVVRGAFGGACMSGPFTSLGLALERQRGLFGWGLFEGFESCADVVRQRAGTDGGALALRVMHRPDSCA